MKTATSSGIEDSPWATGLQTRGRSTLHSTGNEAQEACVTIPVALVGNWSKIPANAQTKSEKIRGAAVAPQVSRCKNHKTSQGRADVGGIIAR